MPEKPYLPKRFHIASPCAAEWDSMSGNERVRFCDHCRKSVHNLSGMTTAEAHRLVEKSGGRLCVRFVRRPEAVAPVRERLHRITRRASKLAAGAFASALGLCASVAAQTPAADGRAGAAVSQASDAKEQKSAEARGAGAAAIVGTVTDPQGAVVPGARVAVENVLTGARHDGATDEEGVYRIDALAAGTYKVAVEANGFKRFELIDVVVGEGSEQRADAQVEVGEALTGVVVVITPTLPLVRAAAEGDLAAVRALLAEGADPNGVDGDTGLTALSQAVSRGSLEMVNALLGAGADPNLKGGGKRAALSWLPDGDAAAGIARALLSAGAKLDAKDEDGNTALMFAAAHDSTAALKALLDAGAKVDARNEDGRTALSLAAADGNLESVRLLVVAGADLNRRDKEGRTALTHARESDHAEVMQLLVARGAVEYFEEEN